ncbi:MAG: hypothetical protein JWM25_157 [Thermoleophilia bacterium]|nr:hypothetical protein [Thermoleophilia bacterium]
MGMAPDDPIPPVGAIGSDPVEPVVPPRPVPQASPAPPLTGRPPIVDIGERVGAAAVHAQLEHPVQGPPGLQMRATVHDAAAHGNAIAAAIERARSADPTNRAQQLGGAAAVAGSGQASPIERTTPAPAREDIPATDPLAAIRGVGDDEAGDDQGRHDRHAFGDERIEADDEDE